MKRKYICIALMVLMICAPFPGMMVSGDCDSCNTENTVPYTVQDLNEFSLEADEMLETLSKDISEKVGQLKERLKDPPSEKDENLSALINALYDDYTYYRFYTSRKAVTDTVKAMTTEKNGYLIITKTEIVADSEIDKTYLYLEDHMRSLSFKNGTLRSYYDQYENTQVDYCALLDEILSIYDKYIETAKVYATLVTQRDISWQAERQEFLTRDSNNCTEPGAGDSLEEDTGYYMSDFTWVKAWMGVYSSQVPNTTYITQNYCTTSHMTLTQFLAYANDTYGPWNVGSIQIKYFFLADEDAHQHNAIYEGNMSNYNLNGNYYVGDALIEFTNGVAWTYGAPYDGSSTPSDGTYEFKLWADHLYGYVPCCTPTSSPDDTTYDQWCNRHCYSCFACDVGADQNFITDEP